MHKKKDLGEKINKFYNYFDMIKNLNYNKVRTREEIVMDSLTGKVALVTGASRGLGSAIAKKLALNGASVIINYSKDDIGANNTLKEITKSGGYAKTIKKDISYYSNCIELINEVITTFGKIDILVNNHAVQFVQNSILDITSEQLDLTFRTNVYPFFYMTKAALKYLKRGAAIINTTSITAYQGEPLLIDYSATKGAILTFTRSLSQSLIKEGIRVNAVAPGPIWTPLIPASYSVEQVETFGSGTSSVPMG